MLPSRSLRNECDVTTEATGVVVGSTISATGGAVTGRFLELRNQPPLLVRRACVCARACGMRTSASAMAVTAGLVLLGSSRLRGDVAAVAAGAVRGLMGSVE